MYVHFLVEFLKAFAVVKLALCLWFILPALVLECGEGEGAMIGQYVELTENIFLLEGGMLCFAKALGAKQEKRARIGRLMKLTVWDTENETRRALGDDVFLMKFFWPSWREKEGDGLVRGTYRLGHRNGTHKSKNRLGGGT